MLNVDLHTIFIGIYRYVFSFYIMANLEVIIYYRLEVKKMSSDNNNLKVEVRKGVLIYKASKGQLKDVDEEAQKVQEDINESRQQNPQN